MIEFQPAKTVPKSFSLNLFEKMEIFLIFKKNSYISEMLSVADRTSFPDDRHFNLAWKFNIRLNLF